MRARVTILVFVLLLCPTSFANQQLPAPQPASMPQYPDSPQGLAKLMKNLLAAAKTNQGQVPGALLTSFFISNPGSWFARAFGDEKGKVAAAYYASDRNAEVSVVADALQRALREKMTEVEVHVLDQACNPEADEYEYPVLLTRQQDEPFYDVRLMGSGRQMILWFFAYVDGGFRFFGGFRFQRIRNPDFTPGAWEVASASAEPRLPLGSGQTFNPILTHGVQPAYPQKAKDAHLQGKVWLEAILATDGSVKETHLLRGHCWLAEAALHAVRQWRYRMPSGTEPPRELLQTIEVKFTISR